MDEALNWYNSIIVFSKSRLFFGKAVLGAKIIMLIKTHAHYVLV